MIDQGLGRRHIAVHDVDHAGWESRLGEQGAGIIVVDARGGIGQAWSTPRLAFAWRSADGAGGVGP